MHYGSEQPEYGTLTMTLSHELRSERCERPSERTSEWLFSTTVKWARAIRSAKGVVLYRFQALRTAHCNLHSFHFHRSVEVLKIR